MLRFITALLLIAVALLFAATASAAARPRRRHPFLFPKQQQQRGMPLGASRANLSTCEIKYFTQRLDHFSFSDAPAAPGFPVTFRARYYICGQKSWAAGSPIFFYTGNEVNVDLLVNQTGLMWENQARFGALLIFAEHRYFGETLPFPGESMPSADKLRWLTVEQCLRDYAELVYHLRKTLPGGEKSALIAVGGSYGAMLASYARNMYPTLFDGAIAGSAPVHFASADPGAFAMRETTDATTVIDGSGDNSCALSFVKTWQVMQTLANTASGLAQISAAFKTCKPLASDDDAYALMEYVSSQVYFLAMGSYSWPSGYMLLGGAGVLPPYPLRVACSAFGGKTPTDPVSLMEATSKAMMVYFNASGSAGFTCLNPNEQVNEASEITGYLWDYLACGSMFMPMSQNGLFPQPGGDMFYSAPWNNTAQVESCQQQYGATPQATWSQVVFGNLARTPSIVFSNGALDPWMPSGVLPSNLPPDAPASTHAIVIPDYGHHADLFFSHPNDSAALKAARAFEASQIAQWIEAKKSSFEKKKNQKK